MSVAGCTCPVPFTEESVSCAACVDQEIEALLESDRQWLASQGLTYEDLLDKVSSKLP